MSRQSKEKAREYAQRPEVQARRRLTDRLYRQSAKRKAWTAHWNAKHPGYRKAWHRAHPGYSTKKAREWRAAHPTALKENAKQMRDRYATDETQRRRINNANKRKYHASTLPTPIVYFVQGATCIKIGTTKNLKARLMLLRTASPVALVLLWTTPGGVVEEQALHARFAHLRAHGEWFHAAPELLAYIDELKAAQS